MGRWFLALLLLPSCNVDADVARIPLQPAGDAAAKCGPRMVDLGAFCIDATEVRKRDYQAFLDARPGPAADPRCAGKSDYAPRTLDEAPANCSAEEADLTKNPEQPVVCVDWCDALAYCAWSGKRLCGAIGGGPEPYKDPAVMNNAGKSQWYAACAGSAATPRKYPYGDTWESARCSDVAAGGAVKEVGSMPACHGPAATAEAAVFDLSGNVYEWVDNCQASAGDQSNVSCLARGGFYLNQDSTDAGATSWMTCAVIEPYDNTKRRNDFDDHIGIRCCSP